MHRTRVACFTAQLFHKSLSGQIRSFCQLDKSYRNASPLLCHTSPSGQIRSYWIETCHVVRCAVCHHWIFSEQLFQLRYLEYCIFPANANLFSCAKLKQLFRKYPMMTQQRSEMHDTSLLQYDLICSEGDV